MREFEEVEGSSTGMQFKPREEVWGVLDSRRMLHAPVELPEFPDRFLFAQP